MKSPLAHNAEVTRQQANTPANINARPKTRPRLVVDNTPITQQRQQRLAEAKNKEKKISETAGTSTHLFKPRRHNPKMRMLRTAVKAQKAGSRLGTKMKLFTFASSASMGLVIIWGALCALAAVSMFTQYTVSDSWFGGIANRLLPIEETVLITSVLITLLGMLSVMACYFMVVGIVKSLSARWLFIIAGASALYYVVCLVLPIMAFFPVLIIWLWLYALVY